MGLMILWSSCGRFDLSGTTPLFEWYMNYGKGFVVVNGHQNDMCEDEIVLCAQNTDTIPIRSHR